MSKDHEAAPAEKRKTGWQHHPFWTRSRLVYAALGTLAGTLASASAIYSNVFKGGDHPPTADSATQTTTAREAYCVSRRSAETAIHLTLKPKKNEPCAFVRAGKASAPAMCPHSWVCTWDEGGKLMTVRLGADGQHAVILGGTWRYAPAYPSDDPVHDICTFIRREPVNYKPASHQDRCL
jgi:hypothetical protein